MQDLACFLEGGPETGRELSDLVSNNKWIPLPPTVAQLFHCRFASHVSESIADGESSRNFMAYIRYS